MNYLKDLKEQFTFDQLLLIFTCFSFTFPFYILGPILLIEFIYLLVSKKAIIALKQTPQIKFLYLRLANAFHVSVDTLLEGVVEYEMVQTLLNATSEQLLAQELLQVVKRYIREAEK